ncbi:gypsy/ty3 element polyprotein [Cucumis melo var. makuwa]|uniref:Gypsy/ty3 element polyprotein n=1 Tax=Cucumis melo var. makuwa TaxID=1194695 RepID=A0A5A7U7H1_CUCMM|nr:gypsy/ty3 element polyprotein [Cucumis melo var. makuwa]
MWQENVDDFNPCKWYQSRETLRRWSKRTQKQTEKRLNATEVNIGAIKQEIQRIPALEKTVKKMHNMFAETYGDRQQPQASSKITGVSTKKRNVRTEDEVDETEETGAGESSQLKESATGQNWIKFKKLEISVFNGDGLDGWMVLQGGTLLPTAFFERQREVEDFNCEPEEKV